MSKYDELVELSDKLVQVRSTLGVKKNEFAVNLINGLIKYIEAPRGKVKVIAEGAENWEDFSKVYYLEEEAYEDENYWYCFTIGVNIQDSFVTAISFRVKYDGTGYWVKITEDKHTFLVPEEEAAKLQSEALVKVYEGVIRHIKDSINGVIERMSVVSSRE